MSDKIFFSYSRFDSAFVLRLANDLRNAGLCVWLDQLDIPPGKHWDKEIEMALNSANCVLAVISPKSLASDNAMDEVSYALEEKKRVIPIMLTDTETPFRLRRLQRVDFTGEYYTGFKQLLASLKLEKQAVGAEIQKKPEQEDYVQQKNEDLELWEESCGVNTVVAYQKYLRSTNSKLHLDEAWSRLESLQEKPTSRAIRLPQTAKKSNWFYGKKNAFIAGLLILLAVSGWSAYKITNNKASEKNSRLPLEQAAVLRHSDSSAVNKPQDTSVALDSNQRNAQYTSKQSAQRTRTDKPITKPSAVSVEKNDGQQPEVSIEKLPDVTTVETEDIPLPSAAEKKEWTINSKVVVNLMLIDNPDMHQRNKTEQFLKFYVTKDVVYEEEVIIRKGALAKGSLTMGRIQTDICLINVAGVNGNFIPLRSEKAHGRRADVETNRNYVAFIKEGTHIRN